MNTEWDGANQEFSSSGSEQMLPVPPSVSSPAKADLGTKTFLGPGVWLLPDSLIATNPLQSLEGGDNCPNSIPYQQGNWGRK